MHVSLFYQKNEDEEAWGKNQMVEKIAGSMYVNSVLCSCVDHKLEDKITRCESP